MLEARNISKAFGERAILDDVSLKIAPGTITAVIGPSGTGKTTFLRSLALIDPPDKGMIAVDGKQYVFPWTTDQPLTPPYPDLTVVFQQLFLWPHLTIRQNIMLATENRKGIDAARDLAELNELLGMEAFLDRYPNEVSIGQRQRAALARAVILRPKYMMCDEITSALDIEQVGVILGHLAKLKERGIGMMLITHQINFARRSADNIVFIDAGKIVAQGGPEIIDNPPHPRLAQFLSAAELAR